MFGRGAYLITGASKGIGLRIAEFLHKEHYNVILLARSKNLLLDIQKKLGNGCLIYSLDLLQKDSINKVVNFLKEGNISLDGIVHNLGGRLENDGQPLSFESLLNSMNLNLGVAVKLNNIFFSYYAKKEKGTDFAYFIGFCNKWRGCTRICVC